jgi:CheY-like chemotaxis protein
VSDYVLIVDDDPDDIGLVADVLDAMRLEGRTAQNGQEALDIVKETLPCAIVLDLMMPVMDGYEMLNQLSGIAGGSAIPIIVLSAAADEHDPSFRRLPGVVAVFEKGDFSFDKLRAALEQALSGS